MYGPRFTANSHIDVSAGDQAGEYAGCSTNDASRFAVYGLTLRRCAAIITAAGAISGLATNLASAQSVKDAYLQDARGEIVRSSQFGDPRLGNLCWRTGFWTPAMSIAECDPDIAPKPAAVKPPTQAPAPKPALTPPRTSAVSAAKCDFAETLGADEAFEFNQSVLRPSAKARLDAIAMKSKGCAQVNNLLVTGHADRIGSADYNLRLSELRAAAVAGYLASKGLGGAQIAGAGKSLPVKACSDNMSRKALVACLAPNRRVVIEVQGTARQ